jgi:OOP family OmpA-OmpF porin
MFKKIAVAAALVAASSAVFAAEPTPFYAGADVSSTKVTGFDDKGGFGGFVGYKINQSVAVEAGYHRLVDSDIDGDDVTLDQMDVSLIGSVPLTDGFNLYGRIGYNRVETETSSDGKYHSNNALYGIGLGYAFSPVVSARLEVQKPDSEITKLVAGVAFKF